ncbi:hypothetical protein phiA019_0165 [Aeromonas phage phiA019]|nr:hypothetical protein phiA009_0168 [Aeromonas phage phiA009]ULG01701.1 hypothetical protein phiA019_0165 [Aeromonas phage phiA019]
MNLVDAVVTKVLSKPHFKYNYWFVDVEYNSYGRTSKTNVMCSNKESAKAVKVGYTFKV